MRRSAAFLPLALLAACYSGPTAADAGDEGFFVRPPEIQYVEDPGPDDDWFGRIVINNRDGSTGGGTHFETAHGRIRVDHVVTLNAPCKQTPPMPWEHCADLIYTTTPPQILARPGEIEAQEESQSVIYLFVENVGS